MYQFIFTKHCSTLCCQSGVVACGLFFELILTGDASEGRQLPQCAPWGGVNRVESTYMSRPYWLSGSSEMQCSQD